MKAAMVSGPSSRITASASASSRARELRLALSGLALAVEVRTGQVSHGNRRQIEIAVVVGQPREAAGRHRDAVIAPLARQELFLPRPSERVVVVPDQLDDGVVGFRAGVGEEHARELRRRHRDQLLTQADGTFVRFMTEDVVVRQLRHLRRGGLRQARFVEANGHRPQAGHGLDVFVAGSVVDVDALAAIDHDRAGLLVQAGIRVRMQFRGDVRARQRVGKILVHKCHVRRRPGRTL